MKVILLNYDINSLLIKESEEEQKMFENRWNFFHASNGATRHFLGNIRNHMHTAVAN